MVSFYWYKGYTGALRIDSTRSTATSYMHRDNRWKILQFLASQFEDCLILIAEALVTREAIKTATWMHLSNINWLSNPL